MIKSAEKMGYIIYVEMFKAMIRLDSLQSSLEIIEAAAKLLKIDSFEQKHYDQLVRIYEGQQLISELKNILTP